MEIEGPPGRAVVVGKRKSRWSQVWTKNKERKREQVEKRECVKDKILTLSTQP